jgi:hypothetical protein
LDANKPEGEAKARQIILPSELILRASTTVALGH